MEAEGRGSNVEDLPKPGDFCTIMYTSGTTGVPKGVLLTHASMVATVYSMNSKTKKVGQ